jgi:hypothetical protein
MIVKKVILDMMKGSLPPERLYGFYYCSLHQNLAIILVDVEYEQSGTKKSLSDPLNMNVRFSQSRPKLYGCKLKCICKI